MRGKEKVSFKKYGSNDIKIRSKDIAGCEEAKQEVLEYVDFLKNP